MRQITGAMMSIDEANLVKTMMIKVAGGSTNDIKIVNFDSRNAEGERWHCTCRATVECRHIKFSKAVQNFMNDATTQLLNFDSKEKPATSGVSFNEDLARSLNK